jgi:dolichol-phosphate mannosyltransferase
MKQLIKQNLPQLIKMCLVGSIGMMVQFISFNLLRFYLSPLWAVQTSIIFAILTNFYAHGRLTFAQGGGILSKRGGLFLIYSLFMLFLQGQWLVFGISLIGTSPIKENIIIFCGMGWGTLINYIFYKNILWRKYRVFS